MPQNPHPASHRAIIAFMDDDPDARFVLEKIVRKIGFEPKGFAPNEVAQLLQCVRLDRPALILLDQHMVTTTGVDVLKKIRAFSQVPAIFISGDANPQTHASALRDVEADDFIQKPFDNDNVILRVRAVLRRSSSAIDSRVSSDSSLRDVPFTFSGSQIDPGKLTVKVTASGASFAISSTQLGVLAAVSKLKPGAVITRAELLHAVWGPQVNLGTRTDAVTISNLRKLYTGAGGTLAIRGSKAGYKRVA